MVVDQSGATIRKLPLAPEAALRVITELEERGIDIWVFPRQ